MRSFSAPVLTDRRKVISPLPARIERLEKMHPLFFLGRIFEQRKRLTPRQFEQFAIAQRIRDMETQRAVLPRAEEFARPA
jgi:hypothetical protein